MKNNKTKIALGSIIYTLIILAWHLTRGALISDDAYRMENPVTGSFFDIVGSYWRSNGRATLDALAEFFVQHYAMWKLVDTVCFIVIGVLLFFIFSANNYKKLWALLGLVLLIPLSYLDSAGYVSTTTNYMFTAAAGLMIALELSFIVTERGNLLIGFIFALVGISYTMFHDQFMMVVILAELMTIIYMIFAGRTSGEDRAAFIYLCVLQAISIIAYIVVYFSPGHQNRMQLDKLYPTWLPEFANWTLGQKIYEGYTTTVANLIFQKVDLFIVICLLLAFMGMKADSLVKKLVGIAPIAIIAAMRCLSLEKFIVFYDYACGLPDMVPLKYGVLYIAGFAASIVIVVCVILGMGLLINDPTKRFFAIGLMIIGAISREIMGFSSTIYASSYRTFIAFLFCMILAIGLMIEDMEEEFGEKIYSVIAIVLVSCFIL